MIVRKIVRAHPQLTLLLKKADLKYTPFQYVFNTLFMTGFSLIVLMLILFTLFRQFPLYFLVSGVVLLLFTPVIFRFWFGLATVKIARLGRDIDSDLMFASEFLLVEIESGVPLGNAIERLSQFEARPVGRFFKRVYFDFKTGRDLQKSLEEAVYYSPSPSLRVLLKRLKDSMSVGVDLVPVLNLFIEESNERSLIEIKKFSKSINPLIMMYLVMGVVFPSLGIALLILGASLLSLEPLLLRLILIGVFLLIFVFQYLAYTIFKYKKDVIKL